MTSKTEAYVENLQYTQDNAALFTEIQQDHTMALKSISTPTQDDRTPVALLTKTIAEISTQVFTLTKNLATAQSDNARLKIYEHSSARDDHGHRLANVQVPSDKNPLRDRNIYSRIRKKLTPMGIAHLTGLSSRSPILTRLDATR